MQGKNALLEVDLDELFVFDIDEMWNIIDLLAYFSTDVMHSITNSNTIYLCFNLQRELGTEQFCY